MEKKGGISFHHIFRAPKSHFSPEKSPGVLPDVCRVADFIASEGGRDEWL